MYFQRLKNLREDSEFKQNEIVSKLNCKRSTYANWENGTIIVPLDIADELSIIYNVPLSYVLGLSNNRNVNYKHKRIDYKFLRSKLLSLKEENKHTYEVIANNIKSKYSVPVIPISVERMNENDIVNILKEALYEFPVDHIEFNIPDWIGVLKSDHPLKIKFMEKMKESIVNVDKLRDVENINLNLEDNSEITKAYVSKLDTDNSEVTITLEANDAMFNDILRDIVGQSVASKGDLIKIFQNFSDGRNEYDSVKSALKQVHQTGYGIVLPRISDMKLNKPMVIKQAGRYGVKLQAKASSIHMIKVDVESSFEPIIGSELQSKELIDFIMKDESNPEKIWQSEIFGRSLDEIVQEGIQAKLAMLPDSAKYKLSQTITKMVNKGSNNLIAIVL